MRNSGYLPLCLVAALTLGAPPASAQVPRVVARQNGPVAGLGQIAWIEDIEISNSGAWAIEADTTFLGNNEDGIILKEDVVQLREGDVLPAPAGTKLRFFQSFSLATDGRIATAALMQGTSGFTDDGGVFLGDTILIQEGGIPIGPGWNAGTFYVWFSDVDLNANGQVLVRGFVEDPVAANCLDYFASILGTDASGNLQSQTLLAVEAGSLPGIVDPVSSIRFGPDAAAFNDAGQALITIDLEMGPDFSSDGTVWLFDGTGTASGQLLAREGSPSPVPGRNWGDLFRPSVSLNNNGDWVIRDSLDDSDVFSDEIIVKNGAKFVQEGDFLPAIAPYSLRRFGLGAAHLSEAGDVLWYARWSDPNDAVNEGLFLNDRLLVQEGVTVASDGTLVASIDDDEGTHYISPDGRYVVFLGYRPNGKQVVFMIDLDDPMTQLCFGVGFGANCPCNNPGGPGKGCDSANGLGGARLIAQGEASLSNDTLAFFADGLPRLTSMVYLQGTASSSPIPFGNGLRCVDGTLARFGGRFAGADGRTAFGSGNPPVSVEGGVSAPGERIYQLLYRNRSGFCFGSGVNLSNAVRVVWGP